MKITRSTDDVYRFNVRIEHRVGYEELEQMLIAETEIVNAGPRGAPEVFEKFSTWTKLIEGLRSYLRSYGYESLYTDFECVDYETGKGEVDEVRALARTHIRSLFLKAGYDEAGWERFQVPTGGAA
jgi:hypothetical protein